MQRLFLSSAVLLCASVSAQTTIDITMPGSQGSCIYTTGPVLSNSTPGQLAATASSSMGTGCGGGGGAVSFGPASPLAPTSTTVGNTGGIASFSFQAVNAAQCTGSITGTAAGVFTGGGATTTFCGTGTGISCANVQSVSTTFPANGDPVNDKTATVVASCTGTSGPPITSQAAVTVSHTTGGGGTGGSCPTIASTTPGITNFTQLTTPVSAFYFGGDSGGPHTVDPTSFKSIFFLQWPGTNGLTAQFSLQNTKYISAAFTTPPAPYFHAINVPADGLLGQYVTNGSGYSVPVSMTISTKCGDFSNPSSDANSSVVAGCYANKAMSASGIAWTNYSTCQLSDGTAYFLNFITADISSVTSSGGSAKSTYKTLANKCDVGICSVPLNNFVRYPNFVPQH